MRLIDAEKTMERFLEEARASKNDSIHINTIKRLLSDVDTAYDVGTVVGQLEDRSTLSRPVGWPKSYEIITLDNAIEIVKGGGVNE